MKAPTSATSLARFALLVGSAGASIASAQPAPPAGAGLNGYYAPGVVQPSAYQMQMQRPVAPTPPTPPPGQPPQGYNMSGYRPPTMRGPQGAPMAPAPMHYQTPGKSPTKSKSTSKATAAAPKSNYRPATGGKTGTTAKPKTTAAPSLESRVGKLESNGHRQDLRLGRLERDVGLLPPSIEGGGVADIVPSGKTHIVRPGDTLFSVASRYSTSVGELRSLNRLSDDTLDIGETLLIPDGQTWSAKPANTTAIHVVSGEENMASISRQYGVTEDSIARANPTAYASDLRNGERLTIPNPRRMPMSAPRQVSTRSTSSVVTSNVTHTVKKGEMLGRIATMHGVPVSKLMAANGIKNANKIVEGQKLIIPGKKTTRTISQPAPMAQEDATPLPNLRLVEADSEPEMKAPVKPAPTPPPASAALPPITRTASAAPAAEPEMQRGIVAYRAQRGDTIETVANLFGTSAANIRAINKQSADKAIKEGDEIYVPTVGAVSVN